MPRRDYTPYQKKVIERYYRNRDAIDAQRLQEIVTEIYLATNAKRRDRLWERAAGILERAEGMEAEVAARIVEERDLETLARIVGTRY